MYKYTCVYTRMYSMRVGGGGVRNRADALPEWFLFRPVRHRSTSPCIIMYTILINGLTIGVGKFLEKFKENQR